MNQPYWIPIVAVPLDDAWSAIIGVVDDDDLVAHTPESGLNTRKEWLDVVGFITRWDNHAEFEIFHGGLPWLLGSGTFDAVWGLRSW